MGQAASMCRFRGCRYKKGKTGLHLRSIEEPQQQNNRMPSEQGGPASGLDVLGSRTGVPLPQQMLPPTQTCYDAEYARMESWMDENPEFVQDYFLRKATRQVVDAWLVSHATSTGTDVSGSPTHGNAPNCSSRSGSGATTPVRKISAHEFERGGLLKPIVNTIDGTPTFLSIGIQNDGATHSASCQLGNLNSCQYRPQRLSRNELKQLDEKQLIFELVKDICNELDVRSLCHKILQNVSILLKADRGSLFLVQGKCNSSEGSKKCLVSKLFDVCPRSTVEEMEKQEEVRVAWGTGIAGHVAESGEPVNIPDAYQDERFNREIDSLTGYRTRALLCMPIKDSSGDVVGVAQVINKVNGECFTENDEKVFSSYLQFCGIGLRNAQLYEKSQLEVKRNQVLLDLARMIFEEQSTIEHMVFRILSHMQSLIQCQRVQILLVHEATKGSFSRVFDFEANDLSEDDSSSRTSPFESRFPINIGITGHVATRGETVNIPNAYEDSRFDPSVDDCQQFKHKSILCMAIKNSLSQIIGVIQLINKFDDLIFTKNDENFVEAFAIFCGMGIHNTHMYEKAIVAMAKQSVTLEVLSYHASASMDDAYRLRRLKIPSAAYFHLHDFKFDDIYMDDDDTLRACLRMFLDLDFVERFHIDYEVLCRWLLSVKKNYRNVTYHNWRHAFNVAQMMFAILTATQWWKIFGEIECLALVIGCLCHDLDHRGTNNSFQIKASSPLAQLYSTSTMEHHHFDQCLMILNSPGNQILSNLSSEDYSRVIRVLEDAILSTDLAVYFRKRGPFLNSVEKGSINYWCADEPRELLRAMSMTVCDLSAITKPWEIEKRVADLVSSEFFEQGDMERHELNITPIDIMNREKEDQLPMMQVNFIDSICIPIYEAFATLSDKLKPLVDGVNENKMHWLKLSSKEVQKIPDDDVKNDISDNLVKQTRIGVTTVTAATSPNPILTNNTTTQTDELCIDVLSNVETENVNLNNSLHKSKCINNSQQGDTNAMDADSTSENGTEEESIEESSILIENIMENDKDHSSNEDVFKFTGICRRTDQPLAKDAINTQPPINQSSSSSSSLSSTTKIIMKHKSSYDSSMTVTNYRNNRLNENFSDNIIRKTTSLPMDLSHAKFQWDNNNHQQAQLQHNQLNLKSSRHYQQQRTDDNRQRKYSDQTQISGQQNPYFWLHDSNGKIPNGRYNFQVPLTRVMGGLETTTAEIQQVSVANQSVSEFGNSQNDRNRNGNRATIEPSKRIATTLKTRCNSASSADTDRIPKIVGKLGNLDAQFLFNKQTSYNGSPEIDLTTKLHYGPFHSANTENNGPTATSCDQ